MKQLMFRYSASWPNIWKVTEHFKVSFPHVFFCWSRRPLTTWLRPPILWHVGTYSNCQECVNVLFFFSFLICYLFYIFLPIYEISFLYVLSEEIHSINMKDILSLRKKGGKWRKITIKLLISNCYKIEMHMPNTNSNFPIEQVKYRLRNFQAISMLPRVSWLSTKLVK